MLRDTVEVGVELGARVHRPGRVVRVADVGELCARRDRLQHRLQVVALVLQRHRRRSGAELLGVDHVARERGPAADNLVARIEDSLRKAVDEPVGAGPDGDLVEANVVEVGESGPQPIGATVRVAVQLGGAAGDRLERRRERPERTFVRRELDDSLETELTLHLLDRLAGLVRDEIANRCAEEAVGYLGESRGPGRTLLVLPRRDTLSGRFAHAGQSTWPAYGRLEKVRPASSPRRA